MTAINAQTDVQLDGLVELGGSGLAGQLQSLVHFVQFSRIDQLCSVDIVLAMFHCISSCVVMRAVLCPPTVYVSALDDDAHGTAGAADHAAGSFQRSSVQVGHLGLSDLFHLSGGQSSDLFLVGLAGSGVDSRTGLATCDRTEFLTSPITPQITVKARDKVAARVCEVAKEIEAELIVIGLPLNMDGTEGERARKSRKLAKTVEIWSGLPVRMWDERQTTCAAADLLDESGTFGAKRKSILDSVSATVILDDYLAWRKEHPGEV